MKPLNCLQKLLNWIHCLPCCMLKEPGIIWATLWENRSSGFPTQTGLCSHRRWLEAWNFGFRKKRKCTIQVAKNKGPAKLICAFVFAYAKIRFSQVAAHFSFVFSGKLYVKYLIVGWLENYVDFSAIWHPNLWSLLKFWKYTSTCS